MKKIICIIIVSSIIILFSYPFRSQAIANATVYLEANTNNVIVGDEIEVNINLKGQKVSAYSIDIYFDRTKLEFVSGPENSNTIGNKVKIVWYDKQGGSGAKEGKIENLRFKLIDTGIADFTVSGEFFDENANLIQTDFDNLQILVDFLLIYVYTEFSIENGFPFCRERHIQTVLSLLIFCSFSFPVYFHFLIFPYSFLTFLFYLYIITSGNYQWQLSKEYHNER